MENVSVGFSYSPLSTCPYHNIFTKFSRMNAAAPRGGRMRNRKGNTPDQYSGNKENYIIQGLMPYKRDDKKANRQADSWRLLNGQNSYQKFGVNGVRFAPSCTKWSNAGSS